MEGHKARLKQDLFGSFSHTVLKWLDVVLGFDIVLGYFNRNIMIPV